jgi:hypothetical protein
MVHVNFWINLKKKKNQFVMSLDVGPNSLLLIGPGRAKRGLGTPPISRTPRAQHRNRLFGYSRVVTRQPLPFRPCSARRASRQQRPLAGNSANILVYALRPDTLGSWPPPGRLAAATLAWECGMALATRYSVSPCLLACWQKSNKKTPD